MCRHTRQPEAELSRGDVGPGVVDADGVGGGEEGRRWAVGGGPCCSLGTWLGPPHHRSGPAPRPPAVGRRGQPGQELLKRRRVS